MSKRSIDEISLAPISRQELIIKNEQGNPIINVPIKHQRHDFNVYQPNPQTNEMQGMHTQASIKEIDLFIPLLKKKRLLVKRLWVKMLIEQPAPITILITSLPNPMPQDCQENETGPLKSCTSWKEKNSFTDADINNICLMFLESLIQNGNISDAEKAILDKYIKTKDQNTFYMAIYTAMVNETDINARTDQFGDTIKTGKLETATETETLGGSRRKTNKRRKSIKQRRTKKGRKTNKRRKSRRRR